MKIMVCPLNGPRPIVEFAYGGEVRPSPDPDTCSDAEWSRYVFNRSGSPGIKYEWWYHIASGFWFVALRDTALDRVIATYPAEAVRRGLPEYPPPERARPLEGTPHERAPPGNKPLEGTPHERVSPKRASPQDHAPLAGKPLEGTPHERAPPGNKPLEAPPLEGTPLERAPRKRASPQEHAPLAGKPLEGMPRERVSPGNKPRAAPHLEHAPKDAPLGPAPFALHWGERVP